MEAGGFSLTRLLFSVEEAETGNGKFHHDRLFCSPEAWNQCFHKGNHSQMVLLILNSGMWHVMIYTESLSPSAACNIQSRVVCTGGLNELNEFYGLTADRSQIAYKLQLPPKTEILRVWNSSQWLHFMWILIPSGDLIYECGYWKLWFIDIYSGFTH